MYGAQTRLHCQIVVSLFENDVEMYGAQTYYKLLINSFLFENDVEMYGAQTSFQSHYHYLCLRMM